MGTKVQDATIEILAVEESRVKVAVVGTTPLICNRMSEKVKHELLLPQGKKNAAAKAANLKHDPLLEYRLSPYTIPDNAAPTLLAFLPSAFKRAMMTAALDIPGAKKAQIGRLLWASGDRTPLYGIPEMMMSGTRSADFNRTPDVRTRAVVRNWAVFLELVFPTRIIREKSVLNLLAAAGMFCGVGDWRTEKGSGNYGSFRVASANDSELEQIIEAGGRDAQVAAMNSPQFYDDETENLFTWFSSEVGQRGLKVAV